MGKRKHIGTVDMTPSWKAVLPVYLDAIYNGSVENRWAAREELTRMAELADRYAAHLKASGL